MATMSTPVFSSTGATAAHQVVSITVGSGDNYLLFFVVIETTGAPRTVVSISDGVQNATLVTGAAVTGGAGPALRVEIWEIANPTVGTSNWTFTLSATSGLNDNVCGYALCQGVDTASPSAGTTTTSSTTSSTARDLAITTTELNALIVSLIGGRDNDDTFTWDGAPIVSAYSAAQTATWVAVGTQAATSTGSYNMGGDWSGSPTRSIMIDIALKPAAGGGTTYFQTVAGDLTPAGDVFKKTKRAIVGEISPIGDLFKKTKKVQAGAVDPDGNAIPEAHKVLGGTLDPEADLIFKTFKKLDGVLDPDGALVKLSLKTLDATIDFIGTVGAGFFVTLTGAISFVGELLTELNPDVIARKVRNWWWMRRRKR